MIATRFFLGQSGNFYMILQFTALLAQFYTHETNWGFGTSFPHPWQEPTNRAINPRVTRVVPIPVVPMWGMGPSRFV